MNLDKGFKFTDSTNNEFVLLSTKKQGKETVLTFACTKSDFRNVGSKFQTTEKYFIKTLKLLKQ